jgi:hypothetical protein
MDRKLFYLSPAEDAPKYNFPSPLTVSAIRAFLGWEFQQCKQRNKLAEYHAALSESLKRISQVQPQWRAPLIECIRTLQAMAREDLRER